MVYMKLFLDYLDAIEPLSDAERGRLFTAILTYGRTGEAPQLSGNERFIFPMIRAQMDRDEADFAAKTEKLSEAGRKSAEVRASKVKRGKGKSNKVQPASTSLNKDKDYDKDKEKEKDYEEDNEEHRGADAPKRRASMPPSVEDVETYCREKGYAIDAEAFCDYYSRQGWTLANGRKMQDWEACIRTWVRKDRERNGGQTAAADTHDEAYYERLRGLVEDGAC